MNKENEYHRLRYWETGNINSVILPIGSVEQHGPHACLGTDLIIAEYFAKRISAITGISVMPYIAYGCSDLHLEYNGTITVGGRHFENYLRDVFDSILRAGITRIYVYNGHGSNIPSIRNAIADVLGKYGDSSIDIINWWIEGRKLALFEENEYHHAGSLETSILLAIDDTYVLKERYTDTDVIDYDPYNVTSISQLTPVGSIGTVSTASKKRGDEYIEKLIELLIKEYHHS